MRSIRCETGICFSKFVMQHNGEPRRTIFLLIGEVFVHDNIKKVAIKPTCGDMLPKLKKIGRNLGNF